MGNSTIKLAIAGVTIFAFGAAAFISSDRSGTAATASTGAAVPAAPVTAAGAALTSSSGDATPAGETPVAGSARAPVMLAGRAVSTAVSPEAGASPGAPQPGQARAAPDARDFTHFRVGNRNIKAMLADGETMWVGTSGGVIRYDTVSDEYKVYDVRNGLLSNGVFHLSRLGERIVVGTYGGGLSLLEPRSGTWSNFNIQHGLGDAFVYDVLELPSGEVWIATWSGANRVREGRLDERSHWDLFTVENTGPSALGCNLFGL